MELCKSLHVLSFLDGCSKTNPASCGLVMIQPIIKNLFLDFNVRLMLIKSKGWEMREIEKLLFQVKCQLFSFYLPLFLEDAVLSQNIEDRACIALC